VKSEQGDRSGGTQQAPKETAFRDVRIIKVERVKPK